MRPPLSAERADLPLGRLLALAGRLVAQRFHEVVAEHQLSPAGLGVLARLAEADGATPGELATWSATSAGSLTGVLDTLERLGYACRQRDPADRRQVRVHLTAEGAAALGAARASLERGTQGLFAGLSPGDEQVVRRFLLETVRRLEEV